MATTIPSTLLLAASVLLVIAISSSSSLFTPSATATTEVPPSPPPPTPAPWPLQFHAVLYSNTSGALSVIDLWYDWPNGRNFNIIQKQLGELLYDLEWDNGTSFYYTLHGSSSSRKCRTMHFDVGILRPYWLDGAAYLGQERVDGGFICNVWEKADFITYFEDVATKRPVRWVFYTGRSAHVMTFEVGAVLEDEKWQAPAYCFDKEEEEEEPLVGLGAITTTQRFPGEPDVVEGFPKRCVRNF